MEDAPLAPNPALSLVVLRVSDLTVSRRFYEQLGLTFRREQHGSGPEHLSTVLGDVVLELYPDRLGPTAAGVRLGLVVADLDLIASRCAAAVISDGERDGRRLLLVQDPDGHRIELVQR